MEDPAYLQAKKLTERIAADVGDPEFYLHHRDAIERSQCLYDGSAMVRKYGPGASARSSLAVAPIRIGRAGSPGSPSIGRIRTASESR